jgi:hypothetical protein
MRTLLLLCLALTTAVQGQTVTDHYIELSVSDTVQMRVKRIVYTFTPQAAEMYSDAVYEENVDWKKAQKKVEKEAKEAGEKLKKDLGKEGFTLSDGTNDLQDFNINAYEEDYGNHSVQISVANTAELGRLVTFLRARGKGDGHISKWEYEPSTTGDVELMQRLYAKAAAQAGMIATLGGRKLGKLINAHTPGEGTSFLDLIVEYGRKEFMKSGMVSDPLMLGNPERTMIFRFALVD